MDRQFDEQTREWIDEKFGGGEELARLRYRSERADAPNRHMDTRHRWAAANEL